MRLTMASGEAASVQASFVRPASVAEGGSGLAPSSNFSSSAEGTAASSTAATAEGAAAIVAEGGSGLAPSPLPLSKKRRSSSSFVSQLNWACGARWDMVLRGAVGLRGVVGWLTVVWV
jgi:hypothetical protein